ncbi:MAG: hypothetical protein LBL07_04055 [Tannerella sp.]|jgi:hypothetical protein|nr:hypothetical protein [Tannerella sp.]
MYILSHPEEDWGKLLYFALAYQNRRGEMGAWSPIRSVIIPGMKIHYKPEPVTDGRYETEKNPN